MIQKSIGVFALVTSMIFLVGVVHAQNSSVIEVSSNPVITVVGDLPQDIKQEILSKYGIDMQDFDQQHLQWALELFDRTSKTNLKKLTQGAIMKKRPTDATGYSQQVGCARHEDTSTNPPLHGYNFDTPPATYIQEHADKTKFQLTIVHELGHTIENCNTDALNHKNEHDAIWNKNNLTWNNSLVNKTGKGYNYLTGYSSQVWCTGADDTLHNESTENYAEMIAYYLIPEAKERVITNCPRNDQVPLQVHPEYKEVARKILGDFP